MDHGDKGYGITTVTSEPSLVAAAAAVLRVLLLSFLLFLQKKNNIKASSQQDGASIEDVITISYGVRLGSVKNTDQKVASVL